MQGPAGPFDRWPNALGFDYFWGFLGGESGQYDPVIIENNKAIGVPEEDDFYLPDAMADKTIEWLHGVRAQWFGQAVVRLLLDRLQPRPASGADRVVGQVQGYVRPGLGQATRGDLRAAEASSAWSRPTLS